LKAIFLILGIIAGIIIIPAQAQTTSEFGYQLHPEKLLENTEGILQIFVTSNEMMVPKQIQDLKVISSDNSIIEILGVEDNDDKYTKNILINAKKSGIAGIVLAATGFSSKEISLEVFNNNNYPSQILMKITPDSYPIDGPRFGYITLELATTGGLPTLALDDTVIHLNTPNKDTIKLKNSELVIASGEYYVTTEFEIIGSGDAIIFAETEGMTKISSIVNILEAEGPLKLKLYAFPEEYNSYSGTKGYAIIQLVDNVGIPVLAEEDIHFKLNVENPDSSINTSHDFKEVLFDKEQLVIEKGSYSTFTKFTPRSGLGDITENYEQTFTMFISVENYLTDSTSINIFHDQLGALEGDGPAVTKVLPFLTSGKQEIIAVTYYETDIEVSRQIGGSKEGTTNRDLFTVTVPVTAKNDHKIIFSSSELDTVNPIHPTMKKGDNIVIVFGETGTVAPESSVTFAITDNEGVKTITGEPIGPIEDEIELVVEPLVPMILAEKQFPVLAYLVEGTGDDEEIETNDEDEDADPRLGVTPFIEDAVLTFSANEFIETEYTTVEKNQPYVLMNMLATEVYESTLTYQMGTFDGTEVIQSYTTDPVEIYVTFPTNILANSNTLATVQLLDSAREPVYAKKDIEIKLVSNNEEILQIPQELTIKNGEYFISFNLETSNEGEIELALLSEDFALSKYDINVVDITPVLSLNLIGDMNWNERIEAQLSVTIPEITTALDGFIVEWDVTGGEVMQFDEVTNSNGIAISNIIANDKDQVTISVIVSGNGLSSSSLSKTANILNMPIEELLTEESNTSEFGFSLDSTTIILIIIPVAIVGALFLLKRMDKLEMITDKIPIGDKIEGIKERISDIRNR
jgi:hypothetical protein